MTKQEKIDSFNPNDLGDTNNNMYGLPFTTDEADTVVLPVPWEVTVSYAAGTAGGPGAVYNASYQVDLYDPFVKDGWKLGIAMDEMPLELMDKSGKLRTKAEAYIEMLSEGESPETNEQMAAIRDEINEGCKKLNSWVKERSLSFLNKGKTVALLGGDHSTPYGLMQALAEKYPSFGVLQIDAHADLRDAYEGFEFSHASIMFNALKIPQISKLVQIGIRDYCEAEVSFINQHWKRIKTFFDRDIKHRQLEGETWKIICKDIIAELPELVYISFDIDGLDPKLCPNTGTPVAGGFETEQILFLVQKMIEAGKKIISFDINEIAPGDDEWDANVGARLLYRIANMASASNK